MLFFFTKVVFKQYERVRPEVGRTPSPAPPPSVLSERAPDLALSLHTGRQRCCSTNSIPYIVKRGLKEELKRRKGKGGPAFLAKVRGWECGSPGPTRGSVQPDSGCRPRGPMCYTKGVGVLFCLHREPLKDFEHEIVTF